MAMERRLLMMWVDEDQIPQAPGQGSLQRLGPPYDRIGAEWRIVSHTLSFNLSGAAIMSVLIEAPEGTPPSIEEMQS
jgi:hypothetical protein